jgi:hypothetical protein
MNQHIYIYIHMYIYIYMYISGYSSRGKCLSVTDGWKPVRNPSYHSKLPLDTDGAPKSSTH